MRRLFVCFGLLAVLPVLWPSEAAGQKQKKNTPKLEDATDEDYAYVRKLKELVIVFEDTTATAKQGVIYLDDVRFTKDAPGSH